jgi:hypothetical protein
MRPSRQQLAVCCVAIIVLCAVALIALPAVFALLFATGNTCPTRGEQRRADNANGLASAGGVEDNGSHVPAAVPGGVQRKDAQDGGMPMVQLPLGNWDGNARRFIPKNHPRSALPRAALTGDGLEAVASANVGKGSLAEARTHATFQPREIMLVVDRSCSLTDALKVLLVDIRTAGADDRIGLAVYTSSDDGAELETGLTRDMQNLGDAWRAGKAHHPQAMANFGAGLQVARRELEKSGRQGAIRMIVFIADGKNHLPLHWADTSLLGEAHKCAENHYPVVAVSLGADADADVMQQVADITGGVHFNIPGGGSVASYEEPLKDVFRQVAASRPLRIVE